MELGQCTKQSVTDALIEAMEHVEEMDGVLVIYYAQRGFKGHSFVSKDMKASDCLWLIEQYKAWLLGLEKRDGGGK